MSPATLSEAPARGVQYALRWAGCSARVARLRAARMRYWLRFLGGDASALRRYELAHLLIGRIRIQEYVAAKRRAA